MDEPHRDHDAVREGLTCAPVHVDGLDPWVFMVWLLPAISALLSLLQTGDLAFQIRAGEWMLDHGAILRHDIFTFTAYGRPWLNLQWSAEGALGGLYRAVGWRGLVLVRALLVATAAGVTFRRTCRAGANAAVAAGLVLATMYAAFTLPGTFALRPQLFAVLLFLLAAWLLDGRKERPERLLWLIPIGVVWANVHGSFPLLTVLLVIAASADAAGGRRRGAAWTGALALASGATPLLSPWGTGAYRYVANIMLPPAVRYVSDEWKPLWQRIPAAWVFLVVVGVLTVICLRRRARRPTMEETLTLVFFTGLALWYGRNLVWWALVTPPVVGGLLSSWNPKRTRVRRADRLVAGLLGGLFLIGLLRVATVQPVEGLLAETAPSGLTSAVRATTRDGARVFDGWWGAWFEIAIPDVPSFIDARAEIFSDEVWADYLRVIFAKPGWSDVLDRWDIGEVVASKGEATLVRALSADPGWTLFYEDDEGVVFVRAAAM